MTITYGPFDAGAGANVQENFWSQMARLWRPSGVIPTYEGQKLNALEVYGDSSGMQVMVKSGECWIKGHLLVSTAIETVAIEAADATYNRIDLIVCQLDWVNNEMSLTKVTGTPAGSPVAPSPIQTPAIWQIPLATVDVDAAVTAIAAGDVTDARAHSRINEFNIEFQIGDGGTVITTGVKGGIEIPCKMRPVGWTVWSVDNTSGSIVIDLWENSYDNLPPTVADTIAGTEKPTISSAVKGQDLTLTTWATSCEKGKFWRINVDSVTSLKMVMLSIHCGKIFED